MLAVSANQMPGLSTWHDGRLDGSSTKKRRGEVWVRTCDLNVGSTAPAGSREAPRSSPYPRGLAKLESTGTETQTRQVVSRRAQLDASPSIHLYLLRESETSCYGPERPT
jgi:hypothetical protein